LKEAVEEGTEEGVDGEHGIYASQLLMEAQDGKRGASESPHQNAFDRLMRHDLI